MVLMKVLTIQCLECGWSNEFDDSTAEYDEWLEKEECPNCMRLVADAL